MNDAELLAIITQAEREGWTELDLSGKDLEGLPSEIGRLQSLEKLTLGKFDYKERKSKRNRLTAIPQEIFQLTNLKELYISHSQITAIPDEIAQLSNLTTLNLDNNQITAIPDAIANLANLTTLNLNSNQIMAIPDAIANLANLTELHLNSNQITAIPDAIANLANLTELHLNSNQITAIPDAIAKLSNLTTLDLNSNKITAIPDAIAKLSNLTSLRLYSNQITAIPDAIAQLSNLTELRLDNNQITVIPDAIAQLSNLTRLDLDNNQITAIPDLFSNLANLTRLFLFRNQITAIPDSITQLSNLTTLDLNSNKITAIPDAIAKLSNLTSLRLYSNQITAIPDAIAQLSNLTELRLDNNQITVIPDAIAQLSNLTRLDLDNNQITAIPDLFSNLANLTRLFLFRNQITAIPDSITQLSNLTTLSLHNNQITAIPDAIAQLSNLTELRLHNNQITVIPDAIAQLSNLTKLFLNSNKITEIPEVISNLSNLTTLDLSSNKITAIPDSIAQLSNLTKLFLNSNKITAIPDAISNLSNLTTLDLSSNKITAIPDSIAQLSNLTELFLNSNKITAIPDAIANLPKLKELRLDGNPLPIPVEILKDYENPTAIFDFWAEGEREPLNEAKVILVGQGTVGKTSLVKRLLDNQFDSAERKTEGISIRDWQVKAKKEQVKLRVWDFGGQEIMHATHQFFLTERSLYLLVINTREDERANKIEYWLKLIETLGQQAPVIIVGNKVDDHPLDLDERGLQNKYPNIKAFIGTSCLNGRGISELKKKIVEIIAEQMPHVFDPIPVSWLALKNKLEQDDRDYITFEQYEQKCIDEGITKESSRHTLVRLLHELGIILNFSDDPRFRRLKYTNVLNPEWVTVGAYKVINDNLLMTKHKGVLYWQDSARVFQPKSRKEEDCYNTPETRKFILDMMEKFELCFPMDNSSDRDYPDYLIPDILPKEEPDTGKWDDSLNFEYHYDKVLPNSVISRFIVKARRHIDRSPKPTYWRTGVILASKDGNKAYVKADLEDAKIFVRISGNISTRRIFLSIIRDIFDEIHEKPVLTVSENVALPDNPKITVPYEDLCDLERDGTLDFKPYGTRQRYEVRALLDGIETTNERSDRLTKYEQMTRNRQRMDTPPPPTPPKRNPWTSGSFFLLALVVITAAFAITSTYVPWYAFPIILIAAILAVGIVGALQLRNDEGLAETNFMSLMIETYKRLPLLKQDKPSK